MDGKSDTENEEHDFLKKLTELKEEQENRDFNLELRLSAIERQHKILADNCMIEKHKVQDNIGDLNREISSLKDELNYSLMLNKEFRSLIDLFYIEPHTDIENVLPEDLELAIKNSVDYSYIKRTYIHEFVSILGLCNDLGLPDETPSGLSAFERIKIFIKTNVRQKRQYKEALESVGKK